MSTHTVKTTGTLNITVSKQQVFDWLVLIYDLSGLSELQAALSVAKISARDRSEKETIATVANLYRAQCGGNLIPPISLKLIYEDLAREIEEKEKKNA